jgi:RimJ/RimL family protein N-acetyltransferase
VIQGTEISLTAVKSNESSLLFDWINCREQVLRNGPYHPVHEANHIQWFDSIRQRKDVHFFGIRVNATQQLIGSCQLLNIHPVHRIAELQIRIGEVAERGKGYGTEAVELLIRFGFTDLNLNRIYLHVFSTNERARRTYQRVGFLSEGKLREAAFIDGEYVDMDVMGLLKREYLNQRAAEPFKARKPDTIVAGSQ